MNRLVETVLLRPNNVFCLRNKETNFQSRTLPKCVTLRRVSLWNSLASDTCIMQQNARKTIMQITLIYSSMNIKYPIKSSFQTFIHWCQTLKQAFSLLESHISSKNVLWKMGTLYGDVLTNLFFVFGDVLTNSGTFWLGGVLTMGRFDLHPYATDFGSFRTGP